MNTSLSKQKIITAIEDITEPITISEVKEHLRLNVFEDSENEIELTLKSNDYSIGTHNGNGIDVLNKTSKFNINTGDFNGECNFTIQESDDNVTFYDWYDFDEINSTNDNETYSYNYTGTKQYVRIVAIVTTDTCNFSVDVSNINYNDEDDKITQLIQSAREFGEDYTGMMLSSVTIDKFLDKFPDDDVIKWDYEPLTSITYLKYKDIDGDETTLTENTDYIVDTTEHLIYTPPNVYFPTAQLWSRNAVTIRGVCGYTRSNLPRSFKHALLLHIGYMYQYRETEIPVEALNTVYRFYNMKRLKWF